MEPALDPSAVAAAHSLVLAWYTRHGRTLPWRKTRDPYAILVSEVMLQQTQVDRVLPKWHAWLRQFPTLRALAAAPTADVIRAWQGLGYNLRALRLQAIARRATTRSPEGLPSTVEELRALPGVGAYTAAAVACFAFNQPVAVVDTNVRRVVGRLFLGLTRPAPKDHALVEHAARAALPVKHAHAWNQALMDLGATVCVAGVPRCPACRARSVCRAFSADRDWPAERRLALREQQARYDTGKTRRAARNRQVRGRIVDLLRTASEGTTLSLGQLAQGLRDLGLDEPAPRLTGILARLAADGLVVLEGTAEAPRACLPA